MHVECLNFHQHSRHRIYIDLAVDYIMKGNPDIKLGRGNLTKIYFFATAQTHFLFLGNFYDQIDGEAMGSPFVPVLANLFMGHHEKRSLENYDINSDIEFHRIYVDDTFALFKTEQDVLSYLPELQYQVYYGEGRKRQAPLLRCFLDNNSNEGIMTSAFQKTTYTGFLVNYYSFLNFSYKLGLVRTLVYRIFKINNAWAGFLPGHK